jgi:FtsP/CotA-like multicopper oxidase with cupredoxin domain
LTPATSSTLQAPENGRLRGCGWCRLVPSTAPPEPEERGFKDTVKATPGYFTTIRSKFELPDGVTAPQRYVYHCHIVEHEDNDMMRPFAVVA